MKRLFLTLVTGIAKLIGSVGSLGSTCALAASKYRVLLLGLIYQVEGLRATRLGFHVDMAVKDRTRLLHLLRVMRILMGDKLLSLLRFGH